MTEIELALMHYDGDNSKPYCDLVWKGLKELQKTPQHKFDSAVEACFDVAETSLDIETVCDKLCSRIEGLKNNYIKKYL